MNEELGIDCNGFFVIHPMRYHNKPSEDKIQDSFQNDLWCFQEKKDGNFAQVMKQDGEVRIYMRTISRKNGLYVEKSDNVPHIKQWVQEYMPDNTTLLGELYIPGKKSNDCTKILGSLPDKAVYRQFETEDFGGPMHLYIFDCIKMQGESLLNKGFKDRYYTISDRILENKYIKVAPCYTRAAVPGMIQASEYDPLIKAIFCAGGEGVVFKKLVTSYRPDKRPPEYYKLKEHVDSVDLVIIKLCDPEKLYTGTELDTWKYWENDTPVTKPYYYKWKNALVVGAYDDDGKLQEVGRVASGLTDRIREDMAINPDNYIGSVVQLSCMSLDNKEKTLRHPVFDQFRPDKNPQDCKLSEIFDK